MSPAEFAVMKLGKRPYDWQAEAMESVGLQAEGGPPLSLVAANGSGKTSDVIAPIVLWFLAKYPRGQAIITSGSFRQVEKQLWPAMRTHRRVFSHWDFLQTEIKTHEEGFALGFSTDDPGRAEGWHPKLGNHTDPVMIVVDEAKTVPEGVYEAFDRCTRLFQIWASSPGAPRGAFYDSHHSRAAHFHSIKVSSDMCPHIDPAKRQRDLETYGSDHPIFRSMHLAEFSEDVDRLVIDSQRLAKAVESQPQMNEEGETVAFCDFAAGRDENVLAIRRGNHAFIAKAWVEKDTMQAAREFVHQFALNGLQPGQVWGDADGLGTVMIDAIEELGFFMNRFHGGQAASDPEEYANLIGEVWHVGAREIERGRVHLGQLDPITFRQITTRKSEWSDKGKLRCESKEKMAKLGIKSPDRADALLGCIGCGSRLSGAVSAKNIIQQPRDSIQFSTGLVTGF